MEPTSVLMLCCHQGGVDTSLTRRGENSNQFESIRIMSSYTINIAQNTP